MFIVLYRRGVSAGTCELIVQNNERAAILLTTLPEASRLLEAVPTQTGPQEAPGQAMAGTRA